jgi:large exoprotein involved in heme utilization and adhesion
LASGTGGSLAVLAPVSLRLDNQARLSVAATAGGTAGDLNITTGDMTVANQSQVTVSSPAGQAGNLTVTANRLRLDGGELSAVTGRSGAEAGANITLSGLDFLFLDNESLISANALGSANGGNVTIFADYIIAGFPTGANGSDIIANAEQGNGGRVEITTNGLFGIEFRPALTPDNDITVSSEFGLAGTFIQNDLGIDPSRGLTALPLNLTDPTGLIDRRCEIASADQPSEFVVTGRGGIPASPNEPLQPDLSLPDLGPDQVEPAIAPSAPDAQSGRPGEERVADQPGVPDVIVEPQGWVVNAQGRLQLVAAASSSRLDSVSCP